MSRAYPWCSLFERLTHTEEGLGLADGHALHDGVETLAPIRCD